MRNKQKRDADWHDQQRHDRVDEPEVLPLPYADPLQRDQIRSHNGPGEKHNDKARENDHPFPPTAIERLRSFNSRPRGLSSRCYPAPLPEMTRAPLRLVGGKARELGAKSGLPQHFWI